jgi:cytochrome c
MADEKLYSGHTAEEVIELMGMLAASFDVHSHDEWMRIVRKGYALLKEQTSKLDALQTKHNELHRRCQLAEGAVLRKMEAEQAAGAPIAKRLAMAGFAAEQERRIELESRLGEALKLVDEVRA